MTRRVSFWATKKIKKPTIVRFECLTEQLQNCSKQNRRRSKNTKKNINILW